MKFEPKLEESILAFLHKTKISRRDFLKGCSFLALSLGLDQVEGLAKVALAIATKPRPPVIWLELQDCAGCSESLTRSQNPLLSQMVLNTISLDYHETLMVPAGIQAEKSRQDTMREYAGKYILVVEGSPSPKDDGIYCTVGGRSNMAILEEAAAGAAAIVAVGNCASFGGIPGASPAPTGGIGVGDALPGKTVINIAGCPPIAEAMTNTFAYVLVYDRYPRLDELGRPTFVYGNTIHDRCIRRSFYDAGKYAMGFDDVKAREGYCLYMLGCKGPTTYNACPTLRWNGGVSYPIQSGHPCLGCSEPHFWDRGSFYAGQSAPLASPSGTIAAIAAGAGAAVGVGSALLARALSAKKEEKEEKTDGE